MQGELVERLLMHLTWEVSLHPESMRDEGMESMSGPSLIRIVMDVE